MDAQRTKLIVKFLERVYQSSHSIKSVEMISGEALRVEWSQHNVRENTSFSYSNIYQFNQEKKEIGQKLNVFPIQVQPNIAINSPNRTYRAVVQKVQDKAKQKSNQVIEVYQNEDVISQLNLADHHEEILNNDIVGLPLVWNKSETKFLYIAQVKEKAKKSYFEVEEDKDLEDVKRKYQYEQDFGETLNNITQTQLFEYDLEKNILFKVEIPENIFPCNPSYLDERGEEIILQGYKVHPEFKYGIVHCFNRYMDIFHLKDLQRTQLSPKPPKEKDGKSDTTEPEKKKVDFRIISNDEVSFKPVLSHDGKKIIYFGSPLSPPHINYLALKVIHTDDWRVEEILPIIKDYQGNEESFLGVVGFYCDLRYSYWLNDNKHFVFSTTVESSLGSYILNTETKQLARFNQNVLSTDEFQIIHYNPQYNTLFCSHSNMRGPSRLAFLKNLDLSKVTNEIANQSQWQYISLTEGLSSIYPSLRNCALNQLEEITIKSGDAVASLWRIGQFKQESIPKELKDIYDNCEKLNPLKYNEDDRPLIVDIHGGPHGIYSGAFIVANLYSLVQGYNILAPNFSGSIGYGQSNIDRLLANIGELDAKEIINMIDQVIDKKLCNPKKIIVMGCSYGGYMTAIMASRYADRFICCVLMNPVVNIPFTFNSSDIPEWSVAESLGVKIDWNLTGDEYKIMFEKSPMSLPNKVPSINLLGAKDKRVPYQQSLAYHAQTISNGNQIETFIYPESDHSLNDSLHTFFDTVVRSLVFIEQSLLK